MSTSWEYGDVSPACYPNPGRKRKSGSAKSSNPAGKKKKAKEENETLVIQNMTLVGLKKNEVTCLGEMPSDDDPTPVVEMMKKECHHYIPNPINPHGCEDVVEVVQEGVSYPQANEKETQEAVQELMNELNGMVDQATQTYPPPPPPPEDDSEGFKRMVRMATIFQSPAFQNP